MKKLSKLMLKKGGKKAVISGIHIDSTSQADLLRMVLTRVEKKQKTFIATPNPEFIVYAQKHSWFKEILNSADFAIPDGIGLIWAGRFLGKPIKERITGVDLMEKLCAEAAIQGWTVYLFGGLPGVATNTLNFLERRFKGLKGWVEAGPRLNLESCLEDKPRWSRGSKEAIEKVIGQINSKKPDLLFVALTMEKQLIFIPENLDKLNVKLVMGIGGAFNYLSGQVPRAPKWIQKIGFEWLFRLFRQPWRWKRQLNLIKFIWLVLKEKLFQNPRN